ncbi:WXG100 family type VII secretion target [Streptomyces lonarensis]|uniref:ESAT-6-like protein n=2 Tax=Streptomyces lonarensis TaxID=700599 RepID=A0A7X6D1Q2_9ACTN|nr:WXG100 family type VII secretion target [Streptomyces lonarensis]NJQ06537.1 WXG100 family type VII secretion target [Streptomyces lonarensis]
MSQFDDGNIYMDYRGVDNVVEDLHAQTRAIRQMLDQMDQELQPLRNSWVGDASEQYAIKQAAWNNAMTEMDRLLTQDAALLQNLGQGYRRREAGLGQTWSEVKIGR